MKRTGFQRGLQGFWYLVLLFLYAPLAVVVFFSFNEANSSAHFTEFSLKWYGVLAANEQIVNGFYNSLVLAITSSVIATVLGTALGYGMYKYRHLKLGWLIWLIYLPIVMPDIVYGISEMTFFITIHDLTGLLEPGLGTMIIAHVSFQVPFVALLVYSRLVGLDPTLFEATQDLYATPLQRAWHFILPVLRPAVISAFFLAFTLSIDDFVISFFTAGPESTTLPIFIWSAIKKGITPEINAISTLMILAVFTAAVISFAIQRVRPAR
ncbi:MAG: ABC transporter permease [Ectothiorhodospiraceae bacterium]